VLSLAFEVKGPISALREMDSHWPPPLKLGFGESV